MKKTVNNAQNTSPVETKADFARRLGVNRSTVTRGVQQGRILVNGQGHVYIKESLQQWNNTKGGRFDVEARHAAHRGAALPLSSAMAHLDSNLEDLTDLDESAGLATGELAIYKARALEAKNQMALLEVAISKGAMIHKADHQRDIAKLGASVRQGIERIIDNLAPQLHGAAQSQIENHINQAIAGLQEVLQ